MTFKALDKASRQIQIYLAKESVYQESLKKGLVK